MSNINDVLADLRSKGNALERYGLYWSESDLDDLRTFFAEGIGTSVKVGGSRTSMRPPCKAGKSCVPWLPMPHLFKPKL